MGLDSRTNSQEKNIKEHNITEECGDIWIDKILSLRPNVLIERM